MEIKTSYLPLLFSSGRYNARHVKILNKKKKYSSKNMNLHRTHLWQSQFFGSIKPSFRVNMLKSGIGDQSLRSTSSDAHLITTAQKKKIISRTIHTTDEFRAVALSNNNNKKKTRMNEAKKI